MVMIIQPVTVSLTVFLLLTFFLTKQRTRFLIVLLALESITLTLIIVLGLFLTPSTLVILIIVTIRACEVTTGLALLTYLARHHGTDKIHALFSSKLIT